MIKHKIQQIVYLSPDQKALLKAVAHQQGIPETQIVRKALEAYLSALQPTLPSWFQKAFGSWRHRGDVPSGTTYERRLRDEWAVREDTPSFTHRRKRRSR